MRAVPVIQREAGYPIQKGEMLALGAWGKTGKSNQFGFATFGATKFADQAPNTGIFRRQRKGYNWATGPPPPGSGVSYVLMRTYAPTNPRTVPQQARRTKFAGAIAAWQALTDEQKRVYNKRAGSGVLTGYNIFIREYMLTPD